MKMEHFSNDKFVNFQVAGALTNVHGCIALKTRHGSHLVEMKRKNESASGFERSSVGNN